MGVNMLATSQFNLTDTDIRNLSYRLCEAFGHNEFYADVRNGRFALTEASDYIREGLPEDVAYQTILEVHQLWHYYGPGYERGPLITILGVTDWLERNGFSVYYGPDSGETLVLLDHQTKEELLDHFAKQGGEPYRSSFGRGDPQFQCPYCINPLRAYSWNTDGVYGAVGYHCPGCGYKAKTLDRQILITVSEPRD